MTAPNTPKSPSATPAPGNGAPRPLPSGRSARVIEFKRLNNNPSLVGFATVAFPSGLIVHGVPIFRAADGGLSAGVPSMPIVGADGTHQRDDAGKKRYSPLITFDDREARVRWNMAVTWALTDAGVTGGSS